MELRMKDTESIQDPKSTGSKTILITGSNGRIGRDVKKHLKKDFDIIDMNRGDDIYAIDFEKVNFIIHLAANTKSDDVATNVGDNVEFTKTVLNMALPHGIPVFVTTSWSWAFRVGAYQYSKLIQEKVCREFRVQGLTVGIFELPEVVTSSGDNVIDKILNKIRRNEVTTVDRVTMNILTSENLCLMLSDILSNIWEDPGYMCDDNLKHMSHQYIQTIDLFTHMLSVVEQEDPDKMYLLKPGKMYSRVIQRVEDNLHFPEIS